MRLVYNRCLHRWLAGGGRVVSGPFRASNYDPQMHCCHSIIATLSGDSQTVGMPINEGRKRK